MNGTTRRTQRSLITKSVHKQFSHLPYSVITETAKLLSISNNKDGEAQLIAALKKYLATENKNE